MTWKPPKINYIPADGVTDDDLNRVEGNTLDNHDRVDKIVDGTIPAAEATNADNADKLDGKHYADIQSWVNASADVPEADHADNADNADNADTVDGKHWVNVASGNTNLNDNASDIISLNSGGVHHLYIYSVYDTNGSFVTHGAYSAGIGEGTAVIQQDSNGVDVLKIKNATGSGQTFYYEVWELI